MTLPSSLISLSPAETIIHGNDADYIQLESRYCTALARNRSATPRKLDAVPSARMGIYRALAGDVSDNIPGVVVSLLEHVCHPHL